MPRIAGASLSAGSSALIRAAKALRVSICWGVILSDWLCSTIRSSSGPRVARKNDQSGEFAVLFGDPRPDVST